MEQSTEHLGFGPDAISVHRIDGDLENVLLLTSFALDEKGIGTSAAAKPVNNDKAAVKGFAWRGTCWVSAWWRCRFWRQGFLLSLRQIVEELTRIARPVANNWSRGGTNHLFAPGSDAVHRA